MFKNFSIYQLTGDCDLSLDVIESAVAKFAEVTMPAEAMTSLCWVAALGHHASALYHGNREAFRLKLQRSKRVMPAAVIKQRTDERCAEILALDPSKYEKNVLPREVKLATKEAIIAEMMKTAFIEKSWQEVLILPESKLLLVEGGSSTKCEELLSFFRKTLGSLPVKPVAAKAPLLVFQSWFLEDALPIGFKFGYDFEFVSDLDDSNKAVFKQQDADSDEVTVALAANKMPHKLALIWRDKLSFELNSELQIKKLKSTDLYDQQIQPNEDPLAELDSQLHLFAGEIKVLLSELMLSLQPEVIDSEEALV